MVDSLTEKLHLAVKRRNVKDLQTILIPQRHLVNAKDWTGCTLLYNAAYYGCASVVEILVRLGSAIDEPLSDSYTPMHSAAQRGRVSVIEILVRLGSRAIDTPSRSGRTPMHVAALTGKSSVIKTLIRFGSQSIDTPDDQGDTPMFKAINTRQIKTAMVLWYLGASPSIKQKRLGDYDEEEAAKVRYEVYFAWPLLQKCLFEIERHHALQIRI